jgi:hypothetical protein
VAVAPLAAGADVGALLHQGLRAAPRRPVALAGTGELEVDGVRRRQLLRAFDEGRRLVLVVGALGLCEQLADRSTSRSPSGVTGCPTWTASSP